MKLLEGALRSGFGKVIDEAMAAGGGKPRCGVLILPVALSDSKGKGLDLFGEVEKCEKEDFGGEEYT